MTASSSYVLASADDAYEQGDGAFDSTAIGAVVGALSGPTTSGYLCAGFRVPLDVPHLATCDPFYLHLFATDLGIDCTIYAHASDDSPDFSTNANIISAVQRPRSSASVAWLNLALSAGYNQTPDLSGLVQETVNRSGWVSGAYINFLLIATVGSGALATFSTFDNGSNLPYLTGSYSYDPAYTSVPRVGKKLDFGPVNINTTLDKTITVTESGSTPLEISNPALTGTDAARFSIESPSFPLTIADGDAAQDITLRCAPTATGHLTATLTMDTNDPAYPTVSYTLLADALDIADWAVQLDSDRDDTFDNAIDDITDYVLEGNWNNGLKGAYDNRAEPARLRLKLDNTSGVFGQDNPSATYYSALKRGTLVRILATDPSTSLLYQLCKLKIAGIQLSPGSHTERAATIICEDPMLDLLDADYQPPLQTNQTADVAIKTMMERVKTAYPYPASYWMLGVAGSSELGQTTYLLDHESYIDLETGITSFPYIGDNTDQGAGISPQMLIGDLIAAEDGRLWWDARTAKMVFHNRHHDYLNATSMGTFTQDHGTGDYRTQEDVINEVVVQFEPRQIGAVGSTLWSAPNLPLLLKHGETKQLQARYVDPNIEAARVGAQDVQPSRPGLDFIANVLSDGSGQDVTGQIYCNIQPNASSAEVTLRNSIGTDCYVTTLQIRGTPIVSYDIQAVTARDAVSARNFDFRRKTYTIRMIPTESEANSFAHHKKGQFSTPAPRFESFTLYERQSAAIHTHALARTVGDRVRLTDSHTSHDGYYIIVGEAHSYQGAPQAEGLRQPVHMVTWILRTEDKLKGWRLGIAGRGELGQTTYLVY